MFSFTAKHVDPNMLTNGPFHKKLAEPSSQSLREKISRISWSAALGSIVIGVIANAIFAFLLFVPQYRDAIVGFLTKSPLVWAIADIPLLIILGFFWRQSSKRWSGKYIRYQEMLINLNLLDDSLLRLLPGLVTTTIESRQKSNQDEQKLDARMDRLVISFLSDANAMVFGSQARRGLLFCPDDKGEYLVIRYRSGWIREVGEKKFRISNNQQSPSEGVVGEAYDKVEIVIAHRLKTENGGYKWDKDSYVPHDRNQPIYNSMVCVPIIGASDGPKKNCLGVMCFDSANPNLFDSPEAIETLGKLGRHLATSLLIHNRLSQACSASSCIYAGGN